MIKDSEIVKIGNPLLRKKTAKVVKFDKNLRDTVQKMKEIMIANNGVGISANQVGLNIQVSIARPKDKFYVFINPEITPIDEPTFMEEGCLSVPEKFGLVKRHNKVKIKYQDLRGKQRSLTATGFLAHIIQHEIDHINGMLFVDKANEIYEIDNSQKTQN
ncbi:MAG: peptide deformylase [Patescibacteria group bacterium]